jgi:carnitine-CoA ligase
MRRFGENISSFEVEMVISMHPSVQEVAVYAVPAELSEDEVMAAVVLALGNHDEHLDDLAAFCDQHLPYFASPHYLVAVEALPKTQNQKVRKDVLRRTGVTPLTIDRGPRGRKAAAAR